MSTLDAMLEYLIANKPHRTSMKNRFVHDEGGEIWDATEASIADWLDCAEWHVSINEAEEGSPDEGYSIVTVKGERVGRVEYF